MASASKQGGMRAALWTVMHAVLMNVAITTSSVVALKAFDLGPRWEWLEITILLVPVGLHFFLWPRLNLAAKIGISIVSVPLCVYAGLWASLYVFGDSL